jgi:CRISPR-associated protein Cas1
MGLDPYLGYYHQPHYGHATLASDVMEEFRSPLVDRFTLYLVNNKIFKEDDFYLHGPSGSVYLKDEPRKRYFYEYERFINRPMRTVDDKTDRNFRELFRRQAERVRKAVQLEDPYVPYLFRW